VTQSRKTPGEQLRQVSAVVLKALSRRADAPPPDVQADTLPGSAALLQSAPPNPTVLELARWRGSVDALGLRARYTDTKILKRFAPTLPLQQKLYQLLEQGRVEALGSKHMLGVQDDLVAFHRPWRVSLGRPLQPEAARADEMIREVADTVRHRLGAPLPLERITSLKQISQQLVPAGVAEQIAELPALVADQEAFALKSLAMIRLLGLAATPEEKEQEQRDASREQSEQRQRSTERSNDLDADNENGEWDPQSGERMEQARAEPVVLANAEGTLAAAYRAYTTAFDTVTAAEDLCSEVELIRLRHKLDEQLQGKTDSVARWAHRLQRLLLALQTRSWQFDLEEGFLDTSRLTRVVTHPLESLAFKQESETRFPDTVVTVLIDNSGSMRGWPIAMAAMCAEILGTVLERCGVKSEILGFTTSSWRGGQSRQKWMADGRPENPGRLTDLKHIVYKAADTPWRRSRRNLGLMLQDNLLKENIDGEALLWAHERLLARQEPRRILMVISDGAPVDDATLAVNDPFYLEKHLRSVIGFIEQRSPIELFAIGIGHDVTRYYRRSITLANPDQLGEAIVAQLTALFDPSSVRDGKKRRAS
jgi:cobaltochelatase CobT